MSRLGEPNREFKIFKDLVFFVYSYPIYRQSYIDNVVRRQLAERPDIPKRELDEFLQVSDSRRTRWYSLLVLLMQALIVLKVAVFFCVLRFELDTFEAPGEGALDNNRSVSTFACLQTDCRRLNVRKNAEEARSLIARLPLLAICYPNLSRLYEPVQHLGYTGLHVFCMVAAFWSLSIFFRLFQVELKHTNPTLMFSVAPNLVRSLSVGRAKCLIGNLLESFRNYRLNCHELQQCKQIWAGKRIQEEFGAKSRPKLTLHRPTERPFSEQDVEKYALDCLPIVRSKEFQQTRLLETFRFTCSTLLVAAVSTVIGTQFGVQLIVRSKTSYVNQFLATIYSSPADVCSIWFKDTGALFSSAADLALGYNWLTMVTVHLHYTWPLLLSVLVFTFLFVCDWEARVWLREVRFRLTNLLAVNSLIHLAAAKSDDQRDAMNQPDLSCELTNLVDFRAIREKFQRDVATKNLLVVDKLGASRRVARSQADQMFARRLIERGRLDERALVELAEKNYICFCLFLELVAELSPSYAIQTYIVIVFNYVFALESVLLSKNIGDSFLIAELTITATILSASLLILQSASFQAEQRKLEPLVWSFLSNTSRAANWRIRHIRHLWLKQLEHVQSGANGTRFLKLKFTHVDLIQMLIWTGTLFVFVLRL